MSDPVVPCEWREEHPDMYPEFAPEPIVITCDRAADVLWRQDHDGREVLLTFCIEHAVTVLRESVADWRIDFSMDRITTQNVIDYHQGRERARRVPMSRRQGLLVVNEDLGVAGLACPEQSKLMFELGWDREIVSRAEGIMARWQRSL